MRCWVKESSFGTLTTQLAEQLADKSKYVLHGEDSMDEADYDGQEVLLDLKADQANVDLVKSVVVAGVAKEGEQTNSQFLFHLSTEPSRSQWVALPLPYFWKPGRGNT